jgi:signal transduction histidine kinase
MARRSIQVRIVAAFFLSLIALASTIGYGIIQLRVIGTELDAVNSGFLPMAKVGIELTAIVRQLDRDHDRFARAASRADVGRRANAALYRAGIHDSVHQGRLAAARAKNIVTHPSDIATISRVENVLEEVESQSSAYEQAVGTWLTAQEASNEEEANRLLADLDRRRQALAAGAALTQALVEGQVEQVSHRTAKSQDRALVVSGSLGALAILLSCLLTGFALVALRPINQLTEQVQRVAAGDLTGRIDLDTNDEMGMLAQEFNTMAKAVADRDQTLQEKADILDKLSLRLRKILDTITAGLIVIEEGTIQVANPAATELWGLAPDDDLPQWLSSLQSGHYESIQHDAHTYAVQVVPFGKQGTLIVGEDVTQRNRTRERLVRSERLAIVGQMLAQITHEVRNPLNAMSLNAELLTEETVGEESTAMLATITGEIRRLEQITARYLHLSRKRVPELTASSPISLVNRVLKLEAPVLEQAGVTATVDGKESPLIKLDADAIERTLRNLVRNAVEAGATKLQFKVETSVAKVRITLADDGPGMNDTEAEKAFDPFFTTKARGTGLGLAISRQEIEEIGGSLEYDSPPETGAKFTIDIPVNS